MEEALLDSREKQACDLLAAAECYQPKLLAVAVKLAGGSREAGMDLFQQTVLNCHDAVQRWGFDERRGEYRFYLLTSLRNLYYKQARQPQPAPLSVEQLEGLLLPSAEADPYTELAEQMAAEVRENFSFADRVALRMHLDGMSCQQIAEHIGKKDQSWVWRRIERVKSYLRQSFQQSYDALSE